MNLAKLPTILKEGKDWQRMLPGAGPTGLTVDVLLSGYRLFGVTYQVTEKVRLGDLLNSGGEAIKLRHASILGLKGQVMATLPEVTVEKRQLIAAIPKESEDYQHRARLFRAGMAKPDLVKVPVLAIIPPYAAAGKVHVSPTSDLSEPERSGLSRFFPLTDAVVFIGEERLYQGPIVLVNRDLLAMLGKTGEEVRDQSAAQASNAALADFVSSLSEHVRQ